MPARTVTCPECGAAVPYGRLSCIACGSLLASVAGASRAAPLPAPEARTRPARTSRTPRPALAPAAAPAIAEMTAAAPERAPTAAPESVPTAAVPARQPAPFGAPVLPGPAAVPAGAGIAGAYLPPSAMFAVTPDATGRARVTQPIPLAPSRQSPSTPERRSTAGRAGAFADLPLDAPDDLATWLVAIGSAIAVVGFVMPWGENGMIGGGVDSGFLSRWGLANAANLVPLVAALAVIWVQLAPNVSRTPARTAASGLLLGGPLAGFAFVYGASPFGLGTGGVGVVVGAVLLLAGGLLALRSRHAPHEPAV